MQDFSFNYSGLDETPVSQLSSPQGGLNLQAQPVNAQKMVYINDYSGSPDKKYIRVLFISSGSGKMVIDGTERQIKQGMVSILDGDAAYKVLPHSPVIIYSCSFLPELFGFRNNTSASIGDISADRSLSYFFDNTEFDRTWSRVPKINLDSADAQRVNQEILDDFGATAEETLRLRSEGGDAGCYEISWDLCWYENTFALIVQKYFEGDYVYHRAYSFDYATGSQLTFEELLAAAGFTEERFRATLREAAEAKFREIWPEETQEQFPDVYAQTLEWTLSDENIQSCRQVFRSEAGDLMVILEIGSLAGASSYEQIFPLAMG